MDRREFIKAAAATAAVAAVTTKVSTKAVQAAEKAAGAPDMIVVRNGDSIQMFRKGIEELGGMKAFVKPGQKVVVKPNAAWDRTPEEAANTNPELVAEIVRQALAAGASQVEVFDNTCNEWKSSYTNSGIEAAVTKAGGKMLPAHLESHFEEVERPEAVQMKKALIHKSILNADVFINVPILKNHGGAKMTAAMKNFMGLLWDRKYMHRNNLPQCIADASLYKTPDLNIVDAYRIMVSNGPRGVSKADVQMPKYMIMGKDIVAVDTMAARLIGYDLKDVPYIGIAEKMGIGSADTSKLKIARLEA